MPTVEWSIPFKLITAQGTLILSVDGRASDGYVLVPSQCSAGLNLRRTDEDIPQGHGSLRHEEFKSGYTMHLAVQLFDSGKIADGATRRAMYEELMLHLDSLVGTDGRVVWTPSGAGDDRLLDGVQLSEWPDPTGETTLKTVTFSVKSRFPYAIDSNQTVVTVSGGSGVVTNDGNTPFYPVIKPQGAFDDFAIINESVVDEDGNPLQIVYDHLRAGAISIAGGHYVEITTFGGGKAYKDGDGANVKKAIDVLVTDFFPLAPGDNTITVTGAPSAPDVDFLVNNAFV